MWLRIDDGFFDHPKVRQLSDHAFRVYIGMLCYSAQYLADGELSASSARAMVGRSAALMELVSVGLATCSDGSDGREAGAVTLHDFLVYNPPKQEVEEKRRQARERQQAWRDRQRNAVTNAVTGRAHNAVTNATPSRPVPDVTEVTSSAGPRKRDPIWDGFADWLGHEPATKTERGRWNAAAKQLRDIGVDEADDVVSRGRRYQAAYPGIVPTVTGLVAHWSELNGSAPAREEYDPDWIQHALEREEAKEAAKEAARAKQG